MSSSFPQWIHDTAIVCSIIGVFITIYILIVTKELRKSFLLRARVPELLNELEVNINDLSENLKTWNSSNKSALKALSVIEGLLKNLHRKLPYQEKRIVRDLVKKFRPRENLLRRFGISQLSQDDGWKIYIELNTVYTQLVQLAKDSRWK